jgi:hypothetical protein
LFYFFVFVAVILDKVQVVSQSEVDRLLKSRDPVSISEGKKLQKLLPPPGIASLMETKQTEWRCSPLKKIGNSFSFLHKTVQEYFVALHVMTTLVSFGVPKLPKKPLSAGGLGGICDIPIAQQWLNKGNDNGILRFCADMVDKRVKDYILNGQCPENLPVLQPMQPPKPKLFSQSDWDDVQATRTAKRKPLQPFSRMAWDVVQASRTVAQSDPHVAQVSVAAGNALMILNASQCTFQQCDLSDAKLSCKHAGEDKSKSQGGLDMSGGIFSDCNFSRAQLFNARMHQSDLTRCNFSGSMM